MKKPIKVKRFSYVKHNWFGPLYVTDSFRDSGGTVWTGINGEDGVRYQFYTGECERLLSKEEFDSMPKYSRK